jgi:hypothetical protein
VPIALAGGLLLGSELFREQFLTALQSNGVTLGPVQSVNDPALGAVKLAQNHLA